ncbi:hypothetical protein SLNHY_0960 [Streptomyces albus]|nr:hypothetical protein SLNHY_0960 [Streptomyces albus]
MTRLGEEREDGFMSSRQRVEKSTPHRAPRCPGVLPLRPPEFCRRSCPGTR